MNPVIKKRLLPIVSSLLLIGTFARASFAAWPFPGEDQHERYILSFRSDEFHIGSCQRTIFSDNLRLKEILMRRVGADIADRQYAKAINRLNGLFKAVQTLSSAQVRSDFLLNVFDPYNYREFIYDGASVGDLEAPIYPYQRNDALVELLVRQSWVDTTIPAESLLDQIEALNQDLEVAHGVPKALTFIRLSRQFSLLAQGDVQTKERFHGRALAQLKSASRTINLIRSQPIQINMLIILGRRYAAMGEMSTAKMLLDQSVQLLAQTKISDSNQAAKLSVLLSRLQAQLGQFEVAWATSSADRVELITAMLKSRPPESVLPLIKQIPSPEIKAQALGAVAIAFAQQGQTAQGQKILEQAIRTMPLDENPQDVYHFRLPGNPSPSRKATIDLERVFPLVANYAKAGQLESALEIAKNSRSTALIMAIKAIIANEYAQTGDTRAQTMMDEVKTQMAKASQNDTYPVVGVVFSELMENRQYRFAWDITKTIDPKVWESYLRGLGINAPVVWTFQDRLHGWQSEIVRAAIADKSYDIALEAARGDYRPLKIAIPALIEAGFVDETLTAARRSDPRFRAELLATLALTLEQQRNLSRARKVWAEANTAAQQLTTGLERARAFIDVAAKLQHTARQPQVNSLLQSVITIDSAYRADKSYQWRPVIQEAIESSLVQQSPRLAIRLVEVMPPSMHRERNQILLFQSLLSFWDEYVLEAEAVLAKMPRSAFKVRSQIALADAYFTFGKLKQSSVILNQAQADLQHVQEAEIIKAQQSVGYRSTGENRTPWLLANDSRSSLLGYIALAYTKIQDRQRAGRGLQTIPNLQIRRQWRSHLACYPASLYK